MTYESLTALLNNGGNILSQLNSWAQSNANGGNTQSQFGTWGGGVPLLSAQAGTSNIATAGNTANSAANVYQPGFLDGMLGWTDQNGIEHNGWGTAALGVGQSALSGYLGLQQLGLAEDSLAESQRQFNANFENQRTLTNAQLEDRQRARVASRSGYGGYESVSGYMDKNGV